jgi:hypothetical protein
MRKAALARLAVLLSNGGVALGAPSSHRKEPVMFLSSITEWIIIIATAIASSLGGGA